MRVGPISMQDACDMFYLIGVFEGLSYDCGYFHDKIFSESRGNVHAYFWD